MDLHSYIRDVADFPIKGIVFKDICPLLQDPQAFRYAVDMLVEHTQDLQLDVIAAPDARGFIFGVPMALALQVPFIPIRKAGKLTYDTAAYTYELEYGQDTLEIHIDGVQENQRVLLVDDLLATGGTIAACGNLIEQQGARVVGYSFLIELAFLAGRDKLVNAPIKKVLTY